VPHPQTGTQGHGQHQGVTPSTAGTHGTSETRHRHRNKTQFLHQWQVCVPILGTHKMPATDQGPDTPGKVDPREATKLLPDIVGASLIQAVAPRHSSVLCIPSSNAANTHTNVRSKKSTEAVAAASKSRCHHDLWWRGLLRRSISWMSRELEMELSDYCTHTVWN
jgi:hypothetical protein